MVRRFVPTGLPGRFDPLHHANHNRSLALLVLVGDGTSSRGTLEERAG
jgi:hypothetical protein